MTDRSLTPAEYPRRNARLTFVMRAMIAAVAVPLVLSPAMLAGGDCRQTVRDPRGRVLYTVEHHPGSGDTCRATVRDPLGRVVATANSRATVAGGTRTEYRDVSGRVTGTADTRAVCGDFSRTTFRDALGHTTGTADTRRVFRDTAATRFRDGLGRPTGSAQTRCDPTGTTCTTTHRDGVGQGAAQGRAAGVCTLLVPVKPGGR